MIALAIPVVGGEYHPGEPRDLVIIAWKVANMGHGNSGDSRRHIRATNRAS